MGVLIWLGCVVGSLWLTDYLANDVGYESLGYIGMVLVAVSITMVVYSAMEEWRAWQSRRG